MQKSIQAISESRKLSKEFGERVYAILDSQGIKLEDFARRCNYRESYMQEVLSGRHTPTLLFLKRVLDELSRLSIVSYDTQEDNIMLPVPVLWLLFGAATE